MSAQRIVTLALKLETEQHLAPEVAFEQAAAKVGTNANAKTLAASMIAGARRRAGLVNLGAA